MAFQPVNPIRIENKGIDSDILTQSGESVILKLQELGILTKFLKVEESKDGGMAKITLECLALVSEINTDPRYEAHKEYNAQFIQVA